MGDRARVLAMINGAWMCQAIGAACELGVPEQLASGPKTVAALAERAKADPGAMLRLLRGLCTLELCEELADGAFALTADGGLLRDDADETLHGWARISSTRIWRNWSGLADSIRTGQSFRHRVLGADDFSPIDNDPKGSALFNRAMANLTRPVALAAARELDWRSHRELVDVGGGPGELAATILSQHKHLRGIVFDLEHAVAPARKRISSARVGDRCCAVAGSFFDAVPRGGDAYLLKSVLHNWGDERAAAILRNCRDAMAKDGKVMLFERIVPERYAHEHEDREIARSDLNMLVGCDGKERTEAQFRHLLGEAGLRLEATRLMAFEVSALVAVPA